MTKVIFLKACLILTDQAVCTGTSLATEAEGMAVK